MLIGCPDTPRYAEIAVALGMTEGAVKKAAQRFRQRYRDILRARIAETVDGPEHVEAEIRALFAILASPK